ncbi:hypothetical protein BH09DEP1_BH09DEP1_1700 [soil metagenome]
MNKLLASYFALLSISSYMLAMEQQPKHLVNIRNTASGWTPLHAAVSVGNKETVSLLLELGADIEAEDLVHNRTPLIFSADFNKAAIAQILLDKGAKVMAADRHKATALHVCCKKGHVEVIEPLILKGASENVLDDTGKNALQYALAYKDYTDGTVMISLQRALKKKCDIENVAQGFALHHACQADSVEDIQALLAKGARIDELDKTGNSAVHYAATNTNPEILKAVLGSVNKKSDSETVLAVSLPSASLAPSPNNNWSGPRDC